MSKGALRQATCWLPQMWYVDVSQKLSAVGFQLFFFPLIMKAFTE